MSDIRISLDQAVAAIRAKAGATTNPEYRRELEQFLGMYDRIKALEAERDSLLRNLDAMRDELHECHTRCTTDRDHYKKLAGELAEALERIIKRDDSEEGWVPWRQTPGEIARKALANFRESQGEGG